MRKKYYLGNYDIKKISGISLHYAQELTNSPHGFVSAIDRNTLENVSHTLTDMFGKQCHVKDQRIAFPIGPDGKYAALWGHALNTKKAFSAFSSLVFLCVLLALLLLYTKLWRPSAQGKGRYKRVYENDTLPRYDARTDQFSLLKSSQDFIKRFKRTKRDRKLDSLSSVKLLAPISEEDDEFENMY